MKQIKESSTLILLAIVLCYALASLVETEVLRWLETL